MDTRGYPDTVVAAPGPRKLPTKLRSTVTVLLLFAVNLFNYIERYIVSGTLKNIQDYYDIDNTLGGLLQTVFICSFMVFAPLFGYIGDRYSRKWLMVVGILIWGVASLAGSFVPRDYFYVFLAIRGIVGIGEASYCTVAPTIIADLYTGNSRTQMLSLFYFAIPVGAGLGFIIGSLTIIVMNPIVGTLDSWKWAFRITPLLIALLIIMFIIVVQEPPRGAIEIGGSSKRQHATTWKTDISTLLHNKSYIGATFGYAMVVFSIGAAAFWLPTFLDSACRIREGPRSGECDGIGSAFVFGLLSCVAGLVGVIAGSEIAKRWRKKQLNADALVCAISILLSLPFSYGLLVLSEYYEIPMWITIFISTCLANFNWSINVDMLMYIVPPFRRSTAVAFQTLVMHAFGDASSPMLIGAISDKISKILSHTYGVEFTSLQYALFLPNFCLILSAACYFYVSYHLVDDRQIAYLETQAYSDFREDNEISMHDPKGSEISNYGSNGC